MVIGRRGFIVRASAAAAAAATVMTDAPKVIAQPKIQWRMSTAWPKQLDLLQGLAQRLATVVEEMSGGRFRIEVFPSGQIMQAFECFEATSQGTIEAFMARKVSASFARYQAQLGPWDDVAAASFHQLLRK